MILLWWRSSGTPPPPPPAQGGGGPPPPARRRFVYDVYQSGRAVRQPATQDVISAPAPKTAVRVVVENQPSEKKARRAAKAVAAAKLEEIARGTLEVIAPAHHERAARQVIAGVLEPAEKARAREARAQHEAQEEQLVISILLELGELDG